MWDECQLKAQLQFPRGVRSASLSMAYAKVIYERGARVASSDTLQKWHLSAVITSSARRFDSDIKPLVALSALNVLFCCLFHRMRKCNSSAHPIVFFERAFMDVLHITRRG